MFPLLPLLQQDGPVPGIKLELFIFDTFPSASPGRTALMEVQREAEFAPVKNAPGTCKLWDGGAELRRNRG